MTSNLFGEEEIHTYLLAIRGHHAEALLSGTKHHEFRRKFERYEGKARVFLYATKPVGAIVGQVTFDAPIIAPIDNLCQLLINNEHDTEEEVRAYLEGCQSAYALPVLNSRRFKRPVSLEEIRRVDPRFSPPWSYFKLDQQRNQAIREYLLKRE